MTQEKKGMYVIGYGSLIFKPPPHASFKISGHLINVIRRFWQSSIDHRGTPENPGRVVTLITRDQLQDERFFHNDLHIYEFRNHSIVDIDLKINDIKPQDLKVFGCAYYIPSEKVDEVNEYLDIREQNGYELQKIKFYVDEKDDNFSNLSKDDLLVDEYGTYIESFIYIGGLELESFIGPEDIEKTAKIIKTNVGPSGKNSEYLLKLNQAVKELGYVDYYLEDLVKLIQ
ncbi:uncharacterized protein KGF55_001019 [Candida pseudojiufengensis]|uniref:uncharacterized protein n=1 Tax=Candida pseudojiufengensis TaxID=497109 RepID=UPI0022248087|nr:uncharacterized protein KGF55_001019 [Candida pseudojiufengensis]KAI5965657.1 hypothetical protein KGF55_001019 [Candida pseudojiufengensis]